MCSLLQTHVPPATDGFLSASVWLPGTCCGPRKNYLQLLPGGAELS